MSFDLRASRVYADLMARAKAAGKAIRKADAYRSHGRREGFKVATRDTQPFEVAGLSIVNPCR